MQCDIEEDLDVVQQDDVTPSLSDDLIEKSCDSNRPLPLGQVEKTAGELDTDVDERCAGGIGEVFQGGRLARPLCTHDEDEPMVEALRVPDLLVHCLGEMPRHAPSSSAFTRPVPPSPSQRSIACFRNRQCRPTFWHGTLPSCASL